MTVREVRAAALHALSIADAAARCSAVDSLEALTEVDPDRHLTAGFTVPARPDRPRLVAAKSVPRRAAQSVAGRAALLHSLAHIEFVAIDLALDMAGRFGAQMGREFVTDFLSVAADEAMHFALLDRKLHSLGSYYGALPAHAGLWEAAFETCHDVAARLAVVPMVLEARGLDVTPGTLLDPLV